MPGDRFYWSAAWRSLRAAVLRERPRCQAPGCNAPSSMVDHIISRAKGGEALDPANLEALCRRCHGVKTARADGGFGNAQRAAGAGGGGWRQGATATGQPLDPHHPWNRRR